VGFEFHAEPGPAADLFCRLAERFPANPFVTPEFVAARHAGGAQPWILLLCEGEEIVTGCAAFATSGLLARTLEIQSLPRIPDAEFWDGLVRVCRERKVSDLLVNSFGSEETTIPRLQSETSRKARREYILHLAAKKVSGKLSTNHKRNIAHGKKCGLVMRVRADHEACERHAELMGLSMDRRLARGEQVSSSADVEHIWRYVGSGAGAIYQALEGSTILSSVLILSAKRGAYYYSAGTSAHGMAVGASHFLIYSIAERLAQESFDLFNLGGADEGGLGRFKSGFGATVVNLEAATFSFRSPWKRNSIEVVQTLRHDPQGLLRLFGETDSYVAFASRARDIVAPAETSELRVAKLTDEALDGAIKAHPEMALYARVLQQLGHNDAYGVYHLGQLVHVSWLIPAEHDRHYPVRNVKLKPGEAEITHAVTLSGFRGKGFFEHAIRALAALAAAQGVHRVFAITAVDNVASQRAIQKAGLRRVGRILRAKFRYPRGASLTFRGHRLRMGSWT
jgi:ribosomal protein S18 acetylase RimI-like enzyme